MKDHGRGEVVGIMKKISHHHKRDGNSHFGGKSRNKSAEDSARNAARNGASGGHGAQKNSRYDAQKGAQDIGGHPLLRGEIVDFATDGRGVLKADGIVCFTEGGVIGDTVLAEATKRKKNFAEGKVREILAPSPDRVPSDCPHFGLCGGCDFREYAYEAQLDWKRSLVESVLRKIGGVSDVSVERIAGAERRVHYRNNVQFPVRVVDGRVRLCFFRKRSNRVVPVGACLLVPESVNALIPDLEAAIEAAGIPVEEAEGERSVGGGVLRHIGVRISASGALCLIAVVNAHVPERGERLVAEIARRGLLERFRIASVYENVHAGADQTFGREWNLLYGAREWEEELLGRRFLLSPASFFQVHREQAEVLYRWALEFAFSEEVSVPGTGGGAGSRSGFAASDAVREDAGGFAAPEKAVKRRDLLDLFCGVGSIGLCAAECVNRLVGIEIVPEAVEHARRNAALNGIRNASFYAGACEKLLATVLRDFSPEVVILDPPRAGAEEKVLRALAEKSPQRIVYVSCNPGTLARDVRFLLASGYGLKKVRVVDLFPYTTRVECIALIQRGKSTMPSAAPTKGVERK